MVDTVPDEGLLLDLLNSTPVIDGMPADNLADPARAPEWQASVSGLGTEAELEQVLKVRQALQAVVRGQQPPDVLTSAAKKILAERTVVAPSATGAADLTPPACSGPAGSAGGPSSGCRSWPSSTSGRCWPCCGR